MAFTVASIDAMLSTRGRQVTLRRLGSPNVDVTVLAMVLGYQPNELVGGIAQGDRKVTLGMREIIEASWPTPIRAGDRVIIDGRTTTVQGVDPHYAGSTCVMQILQVRG